jgi:hypothetical protein
MLGVSFLLILYLENKEIGRRYYGSRVRACDMGHRWRTLRMGQFPARRYDYQVSQAPVGAVLPPLFKLEFYCDSKLIGRREYPGQEEARHLAHSWLAASVQNRPGHSFACRVEDPRGLIQVIRPSSPSAKK